MYRASLPYGRKGLPIMAISAVDLALWDLNGKVRGEPVYNLIGGLSRDEITLLLHRRRSRPRSRRWASGAPRCRCRTVHFDGEDGLARQRRVPRARIAPAVGPDFPLMVDCYMSLTVQLRHPPRRGLQGTSTSTGGKRCSRPTTSRAIAQIKQAHPTLKWTTGEHEYTRYGFRRLIEERHARHPAARRDVGRRHDRAAADRGARLGLRHPVVPHGSGPYSYHFIATHRVTCRQALTVLV